MMKRFFVSMKRHKEVCAQRDELIIERDKLRRSEIIALAEADRWLRTMDDARRRNVEALAIIEMMQPSAGSPKETASLEKLITVLRS
jgi:metal-responsive CopG/Arc/MetJ family transcriptional regulator